MAAREENPREYVKSSSTSRTYPDFVVNWVCSTSRLCVSHRLLSQEPPAPKIHGALPCARPGVTEINWKRPFQARYNCELSSELSGSTPGQQWHVKHFLYMCKIIRTNKYFHGRDSDSGKQLEVMVCPVGVPVRKAEAAEVCISGIRGNKSWVRMTAWSHGWC